MNTYGIKNQLHILYKERNFFEKLANIFKIEPIIFKVIHPGPNSTSLFKMQFELLVIVIEQFNIGIYSSAMKLPDPVSLILVLTIIFLYADLICLKVGLFLSSHKALILTKNIYK